MAALAQSSSCLLRLSREQILPLEAAFEEKVSEIMAYLRAEADRLSTGTN